MSKSPYVSYTEASFGEQSGEAGLSRSMLLARRAAVSGTQRTKFIEIIINFLNLIFSVTVYF